MTTHTIDTARARPHAAQPTRARLWTARILGILVSAFLLMDALGKAARLQPYVEGTVELGFDEDMVATIGVVLLLCTIIYVTPRTAVLGAILLTGYLGGAVAVQVLAGNPLLSHTLFPVYIAVMAWGALYVRDPGLRGLIPLRRGQADVDSGSRRPTGGRVSRPYGRHEG